jgi:hypothetical protein
MRYFKYFDDYIIKNGVRYIEIDENGTSFREVTFNGEIFVVSNILYPSQGMIISDQPYKEVEEIEDLEKVSKDEFEEIWNKSLLLNKVKWTFSKLNYPINSEVSASLMCFYPQGVILHLGFGVLGIADYQECKNSTISENMYPNHKVTARVSGYDEQNQWIIVSEPKVFSEIISENYYFNYENS